MRDRKPNAYDTLKQEHDAAQAEQAKTARPNSAEPPLTQVLDGAAGHMQAYKDDLDRREAADLINKTEKGNLLRREDNRVAHEIEKIDNVRLRTDPDYLREVEQRIRGQQRDDLNRTQGHTHGSGHRR